MASRYENKKIVKNDSEVYKNVFKNRGVNYVRQYLTPKFHYPTAEEMEGIQEVGVVWGVGDRLWKLSSKYYNGNPEYWWIIAFWNQISEMDIEKGRTIYIPLPLERVLGIIEV
ncbi:MAG: hypothetical protein Q8P81_02105 [Nanoarchaeota archaeon]|nr:hypothetical protein [Nanoarchaeota archaeon]